MSTEAWWSEKGYATVSGVRSLIAFEDAVFRAFPTEPPPRTMDMHTGFLNHDQANVVKMLDWLPWPRVIGERLNGLIDTFYLGPSVAAHGTHCIDCLPIGADRQ